MRRDPAKNLGAVYGNPDIPETPALEVSLSVRIGGVSIFVTHGHQLGQPTPEQLAATHRADVIVYGHTHRPLIMKVGTALVVNPGAAGPRRFQLPPSIALLTIRNREATAEIVYV